MAYSIKITKSFLGYDVDGSMPYFDEMGKPGEFGVVGFAGYTALDAILHLRSYVSRCEKSGIVLDRDFKRDWVRSNLELDEDSNLGWLDSRLFRYGLGLDRKKGEVREEERVSSKEAISLSDAATSLIGLGKTVTDRINLGEPVTDEISLKKAVTDPPFSK